ncbi:hypothetical protein HYS00_02445 [Candidatus Microgenomates bacterium]|nr:hypothetical protein [Candidatus Microgenomates bacterium]
MQSSKTQTGHSSKVKNPHEAILDIGHDVGKTALDSAKGIGAGVMDSFFGGDDDFDLWEQELQGSAHSPDKKHEEPKPKAAKNELFHFAKHHETVEVQQEIKQLLEIIHEEIKALERQNEAFLSDVKDIEAAAISELPETPGIYHVRFFETLLSIVRALRMKVGESTTWLDAMVSKKKKRGSLFASRSKDQGTQYSLSQEMQVTRSVQ